MNVKNFDYASYEKGAKDGRKLGVMLGIVIGLAFMIALLSFVYY
ncbi:tetrahydromethanopterin S-methyltransferase subunit G [Leeuwenhoekiella aequorea]